MSRPQGETKWLRRLVREAEQMIRRCDREIAAWRKIKGRAEAFPYHFVNARQLMSDADVAIGELEDLRGKLQVLE